MKWELWAVGPHLSHSPRRGSQACMPWFSAWFWEQMLYHGSDSEFCSPRNESQVFPQLAEDAQEGVSAFCSNLFPIAEDLEIAEWLQRMTQLYNNVFLSIQSKQGIILSISLKCQQVLKKK